MEQDLTVKELVVEVDMSSYVHVDNKNSILGEDPTQELDDTTLTAEKKYSLNSTVTRRRFCLSLHCNRENSYLFVNAVEIHNLKQKTLKLMQFHYVQEAF